MDIHLILKAVEDYQLAMANETYPYLVGQKKAVATAKITKKYAKIFTPAAIKLVQKSYEEATGDVKRQRKLLLHYLVQLCLEQKVAKLNDAMDNYGAKASIVVDKKKVPYLNVHGLLQNTTSHGKRSFIVERTMPIKKKLALLAKKRHDLINTTIKHLGLGSYYSFFSEYKDHDLLSLCEELRGFLLATEKAYLPLLEEHLHQIHVELKDAEQHDIAYIMRATAFDKFFHKDKLVSTLKKTLLAMGYDLGKQDNILLDAEDRPTKQPRAFCFPFVIPDDIRFVVKPAGGPGDYDTILHEAGHAEQMVHIDKNLPYVYKMLGDYTLSEGFAYLFEYLIMDEDWLHYYVHMDKKTFYKFERFQLFQKMMFIRRYAAKLLYEIKLHSGDYRKLGRNFKSCNGTYKNISEMYATILGNATHVKYEEVNALLDLDDGFYTADYCTAWLIQAQLEEHLCKNYGMTWFLNPKVKSFLNAMYACGNQYDAGTLIKRFLGEGLDSAALKKEFEHLLRNA
ncbi:hypothetical protein J4457_02990 [Candidatus Woesearchaeota archaeon]|nr:hypothetical protein [Candidatus Woesearchaeota archaeon]